MGRRKFVVVVWVVVVVIAVEVTVVHVVVTSLLPDESIRRIEADSLTMGRPLRVFVEEGLVSL